MIVLDTHALVWWVNGGDELSTDARGEIEREQAVDDGLILVSSISAWEIAMLVSRDRLTLTMNIDDWLETVGQIPAVRFVPVDNDVGVESTRLPGEFHKDPADRLIVALARHLNSALVTADEKIRAYRHVRTVW
ncbi:type II toxin-antitoxin system VapC family toxin [Alcanivorax marinus]|uniref:Type II toxin-antitoxin system VapC family toxin n=1 Tax=Alloalcanivorax marinus TaxID=1177169 RepID=A0A9Q3UNH2_9GAMM|nr:type II toxin-antitoxin system VapC family toxin [Alloalcanivorax marinus]MCC4308188.1 type II toxin-antitoxin system VapC family toxin [Alloalcanivorax marinus]MCU5787738.1 twitching motility protein PilT [Alloalcanivorax marinus]